MIYYTLIILLASDPTIEVYRDSRQMTFTECRMQRVHELGRYEYHYNKEVYVLCQPHQSRPAHETEIRSGCEVI